METRKEADAPRAITDLLRAVEVGDRAAMDELFAGVYAELRRVARGQLAAAARSATLDTTALVHETYLKLAGGAPWSARDRYHFFATAARAMRMIVIDHARKRSRDKRGGGKAPIPLEEGSLAAAERPEELLALDAALDRLGTSDPDLAQLVEWRFYAGLSTEEIAKALEISERTVKRHWRTARAFLYQELAAQGFAS